MSSTTFCLQCHDTDDKCDDNSQQCSDINNNDDTYADFGPASLSLCRSVGCRGGILSCCETDSFVGGIEDGVETLAVNRASPLVQVGKKEQRSKNVQERVAVDEVKALAAGGTDVRSDEVDAAAVTTDLAVERTRPDLSIGAESECGATDLEVEVGEARVLRRGDLEQTGGGVQRAAGGLLVSTEGI